MMVGMVYIQFYMIASNQGFVKLFKLVLILALFSKGCSDTLSFLKCLLIRPRVRGAGILRLVSYCA